MRCFFIVAGAATLTSCDRARLIDDLTGRFESARKQPGDRAFDIVNAATDRGTMHCIRTHGATRVTYHVTVPSGVAATLSVWTPMTTDPSDDGVAYLIGVSDEHAYRTVAAETTAPSPLKASTKWRNSRFRLDEYEGMTINVVFNTRARESSAGPPGVGLWCSPAILVR